MYQRVLSKSKIILEMSFKNHCDKFNLYISNVDKIKFRSFSSTSILQKTYIILNDDDFEEKVMKSNVPVIVNFHAEWCDPCKILTPKLKELVNATKGIDLAVVDVEKNPELVHTFEVKAVPAVLGFRDGHVIDKFIGLVEASMLENLIKKISQNE